MSGYILEMKNIRKEFLGGKIVANDDITLKVKGKFMQLLEKMEQVSLRL